MVHSAGIQDRRGARTVLTKLYARFRSITTVFVDGGYSGALEQWTKEMFGWSMQVVKRTEQHRFVVLPKRWIVERTFAWLGWSRRSSKDYEVTPSSSEAFLNIAMVHLLLRRLAQ